MKVELSKRAQRAVTRIDARWRKRADHPELFFEEMLEVVEHLETVSNPGTPCPTSRRPQLKRMLLEKTKCHLYFVSNEREQRIDVLHRAEQRQVRLFGMGDANGCWLVEVGDKASKARRG